MRIWGLGIRDWDIGKKVDDKRFSVYGSRLKGFLTGCGWSLIIFEFTIGDIHL